MVRFLIIGSGDVVRYVHVPALKSIPRAEIVGVVSSREKRLTEPVFSGMSVFNDWRRALAETSPDVVIVATPNQLHHLMAKTCLMRGCHVVLEKPAVLEHEEGTELLGLCNEFGRVVLVNMTFRYTTGLQAARDLCESILPSGDRVVDIRYGISRPVSSWYHERRSSGGGVVSCIGIHALDLAETLANSTIDLVNVALSQLQGDAVEGEASLVAYHDANPPSTVWISWNGDGLLLQAHVRGGGQTVELVFGPRDYWAVRQNGVTMHEGALWQDLAANTVCHEMVNVLADDVAPGQTLQDHVRMLDMLWTGYAIARDGVPDS
ncbi:MAG: Gfo/Idh/MocA family oxidoreductase [Gemmatimonadota bacterium]|nr:Gfo/Idh/MocA family oxidoreductase [Gemmatimonadota bacterium]